MNKKNKITVKEVAEHLGVSTATISNAFNRPDQLSAQTRATILEACKKLGYQGPNRTAQILRKGTSNIIALVMADSIHYTVSDPVASTFIKGVSAVLGERHKHLLLYAGDSASFRDVADFVDGVICYGGPRSDELVAELEHLNKPVVTADFRMNNRPSLNIDNREASRQIAAHALRSDDRVAILGLRLIDDDTTRPIGDTPLIDSLRSISHLRLEGYEQAIQEAGLNISNEAIWHIPESQSEPAREAAHAVLAMTPRPTCILCMSDIIALELLQTALSMGIEVPGELRITGFDGIEETTRTRPYLTTVCQASEEKGRTAALMLLDGSSEDCLLPYTLRVGETV